MYEVELKVRAAHGPVRERLADVGAGRVGTVAQEDTYYDAPHRDFAETDEALRLRREAAIRPAAVEDRERDPGELVERALADGGESRLTYKGPLVEAASKTREEFETAVADGPAAAAVLDRLGFEPAATVRKVRERYALDECAVALDAVAGLGEFVEVETEAAESGVDPAREAARAALRDLDLDPDAHVRTSYLGLLLDAGADASVESNSGDAPDVDASGDG